MNKALTALLGSFATATLILCCATLIHAQARFRYMDSSGNLHWVDSPSQIPAKYRGQVMTPTPTPVMDKRAQAEAKKAREQAQQEKLRAEHERKKELQRRREQLERQRIREERELRKRDDARNLSQVR